MYTQREKFAPKSQILDFLLVLLMALGLLVVGMIVNTLSSYYKIPFLFLLPYALAIVLIWRIYKTRIIEYVYTLHGSILIFEKASGHRQSEIFRIAITSDTPFSPYDGSAKPKFTCCLPSSKGKMIIGQGEKSALFAPNERMLALICDAMEGKIVYPDEEAPEQEESSSQKQL